MRTGRAPAGPARRWIGGGLVAALAAAALGSPPSQQTTGGRPESRGDATDVRASTAAAIRLGGAAPRFEENRGQASPEVAFLHRGPDHLLELTRSGEAVVRDPSNPGGIRMALGGASARPAIVPEAPLPGRTNYFFGNDPAGWVEGVPSYRRVTYREVYPGIDLVFRRGGDGVEYDFVVAPGGSPRDIRIEFEGAGRVRLGARGDLLVDAPGGVMTHGRPFAYQDSGSGRRRVSGRFAMRADGAVGFEIGRYDSSRPLVIDPVVAYSTYLGGSNDEIGRGIAVDPDGRFAWVTGSTFSSDFDGANRSFGGIEDVFVAKLDMTAHGPDSLVWWTYLGGDAHDRPGEVAIDGSGNAYVSGYTHSSGYPLTGGVRTCGWGGCGGADAFVTKLDPEGAIVYSRVLGGGADERASGGDPAPPRISVRQDGAAYLAGTTQSENFPVQSCAISVGNREGDDMFLALLNPDGNLNRSCYLGSNGGDSLHGLAANATGVYLTGNAPGTTAPFPTVNGFSTTPGPVLAKTAADFSMLLYSSFITNTALPADLAVESSNAYVTGDTASGPPGIGATGETTAPGRPWLVKVDTTQSGAGSMSYFTFLATAGDKIHAVAAAQGKAWVSGRTARPDFPLKQELQPRSGTSDSFVAGIDTAQSGPGSVWFSSPLGGSGAEERRIASLTEHAGDLTLDASGRLFMSSVTGSADFPWVGAAREQLNGPSDAFVARLAPSAPPEPLITGLEPRSGPVSGGAPVTITGTGLNGTAEVLFDGVPARRHSVHSPTRITATPPAHDHGPVQVQVLAGGIRSPRSLASSYFYGEGGWSGAGVLQATGHSATLIAGTDCGSNCGKVLVAGGCLIDAADAQRPCLKTNRTALFDPTTGSWATATGMQSARAGHTATLLSGPNCGDNCGKVLVAGGASATDPPELFDPSATTSPWQETLPMAVPRYSHTAALIEGPNCLASCGKVVVMGGLRSDTDLSSASVEIYDPALEIWSPGGQLVDARADHTATVIQARSPAGCGSRCGKILVVGGRERSGITFVDPGPVVELYDPGSLTSVPLASGAQAEIAGLATERVFHSATPLTDGRVLVAGGIAPADLSSYNGAGMPSAPLYDPAADAWVQGSPLRTGRSQHSAVALPNGEVFVSGGCAHTNVFLDELPCLTPLSTAEVFAPSGSGTWKPAGVMHAPRVHVKGSGFGLFPGFTSTLISSSPVGFEADTAVCGPNCGRVLIVGGCCEATETFTRPQLYTLSPVVDTLESASGPPSGGTAVTIRGAGFTNGPGARPLEVLFDGVPATSFTALSYNEVLAVAPPHAPGPADVVVVTEGGASETGPAARFTYAVPPAPGGGGGSGDGSGAGGGSESGSGSGSTGSGSPPAGTTTQGETPGSQCPAPAEAGPGRLAVPGGAYQLLGVPGGTPVPAAAMYGWFDQGTGTTYTRATEVAAGRAYWAWFRCPSALTLAQGTTSLKLPLGSYHASMIGNPSSALTVRAAGYDYGARWDPSLNGGAGGYHLTRFRAPEILKVGEGMWAFSYRATQISIERA